MSSRAGAAMLIGQGDQARFIAGSGVSAITNVVTLSFSGMAAGDLAIAYVQSDGGVAPLTPSGWTKITLADWTLGYHQAIFWKLLSGGDISTGNVAIGNVNRGGVIVAYRNATSPSVKSFTESGSSDSTLVLPGFSLSATSAGVLFFVADIATTSNYSGPATAGLADRVGPVSLQNFWMSAWDFTTPGDYPETSLTWTGFDTSSGEQVGHVLELLP